MSIILPVISFYIINPENEQLEDIYFSDNISQRLPYFLTYQMVFVGSMMFISQFFFSNPPNFKSNVSIYLENLKPNDSNLSNQNLIIVSSIHDSFTISIK